MGKQSRIAILLSAVLALVLIVNSCGSKSVEGNKDPPSLEEDVLMSKFLEDCENEEDYDNFSISMEKQIYSSKDECLECSLTNNNPGKGFYFYDVPFVEKK